MNTVANVIDKEKWQAKDETTTVAAAAAVASV